MTVFLASKISDIKFSHSEANLLPEDHEENIKYDNFVKIFGDEGNLIILAVQDEALFEVDNFNRWNEFAKELNAYSEVDFALAIGDIKELRKDKKSQKFFLHPLFDSVPQSKEEVEAVKNELFENLPFFDHILFNKETGTIRTAVYLRQEIVDTKIR